MIRIGVNPGQWGWTFDALERAWQHAEQLGFSAISCFDHISAQPRGWAAWDAPSLLTAIALKTERAAVCVNVIDAPLRHAFLLAGQRAVVQAASHGRLEVGLGIGAAHLAPYDYRTLGTPFPARAERLAHLNHMVEALPALWRGETVTDEKLGLHNATLGPLGIDVPKVVIGGRSRALLELAARHGDGWNAVVRTAPEFAQLSEQLDATCANAGRARPIARTAQLFAPDLDLAQAPQLVRDLQTAGANTVLFVLVQDNGLQTLSALADAVLA